MAAARPRAPARARVLDSARREERLSGEVDSASMLLALLLAISAPPRGHWAVDETGRLSAQALAAFDAAAQALDDSGEGQLGLAVVRKVGGPFPRARATELFNQWHVGHAGRNDGVLLFLALDDHKAEIVLGDR